jgi:hypothetical protein
VRPLFLSWFKPERPEPGDPLPTDAFQIEVEPTIEERVGLSILTLSEKRERLRRELLECEAHLAAMKAADRVLRRPKKN